MAPCESRGWWDGAEAFGGLATPPVNVDHIMSDIGLPCAAFIGAKIQSTAFTSPYCPSSSAEQPPQV